MATVLLERNSTVCTNTKKNTVGPIDFQIRRGKAIVMEKGLVLFNDWLRERKNTIKQKRKRTPTKMQNDHRTNFFAFDGEGTSACMSIFVAVLPMIMH